MPVLAAQPPASSQECTVYQTWASLFSSGQFHHRKAKGIMKVGAQSMVEVVLLQISPTIRKALQVRVVNHCNHVMYAEHVLLHCLILFLLNLVQCPYHGIVVAFVTKRLLHVHQQVLHGDIFAFIQGAGPFTQVSVKTGKDMRCILASSYCSRKASTSKCQSVYITSAPGSVDLKIGISNLAGANHFFSLLPLQPLCQC